MISCNILAQHFIAKIRFSIKLKTTCSCFVLNPPAPSFFRDYVMHNPTSLPFSFNISLKINRLTTVAKTKCTCIYTVGPVLFALFITETLNHSGNLLTPLVYYMYNRCTMMGLLRFCFCDYICRIMHVLPNILATFMLIPCTSRCNCLVFPSYTFCFSPVSKRQVISTT